MEKFHVEEYDPEQLPVYQKQLRQRANLSIQHLNSVLEPLNTDGELLLQLLTTVQQEGRSEAFQDLVPMIHNQSDYIRRLEAEVRLCKVQQAEEMGDHANLDKAKVQQAEEMGDHANLDKAKVEKRERVPDEVQEVLRSLAQQRLQLEGEVNVLKQSLAQAKEEGTQKEELAQTCIAEVEGQLCRAQKKALFLAQHLETAKCHIANLLTENAKHVAKLEGQLGRAQREKRSLTDQLESARRHIIDQDKDNVKHVAELEEQLGRAQREKRSLTDQLESARRHFIDQDKVKLHCVCVCKKVNIVLHQHVAELEEQLGRAQREKRSLTDQLESARRHIIDQDKDNVKMSADLRYQHNQAMRKKEEAERELSNLKSRNIRQLANSAEEVEGLSSELAGCRINLGVAQKEGGQWQDKALSLSDQLANAQRQLNLTRHAVKSAERSHKELKESTTLSAQETHRNMTLLEARHKQRVEEQDSLLRSQNALIKKLEDNSSRQVSQVDEMAKKHRRKENQTAMERSDLQARITSLEARCPDLE
ncbi:serologically defined colon cancer antigen 8 homolog [Limanda limanda]|uniref:serologically defined colon cancer antigen 8 homolog n=1 Tax=Limanda limanda TaxID=27771 RepID=UPI0029C62511|nr:serologically defined colon cancer antigen 8 homolog [Limanda limanda]